MDTPTLRAYFLGFFKGKKVYRFPVIVTLNKGFGGSVEDWTDPRQERHEVVAFTAAQAADYVRDLYATRAETELTVYGPKGGKAAYRFIGWHSAIGAGVFGPKQPTQLGLHADGYNVRDDLFTRSL
jgi:hypothetical protein